MSHNTRAVYFPELVDAWNEIAGYIDEAKNIFITTHVNPDADALGCEMALASFLKNSGRDFHIINDSRTPDLYSFLDPDGIIQSNHLPGNRFDCLPTENDIVILVDLGNYNRLGTISDKLVDNDAVKIIIDHHRPERVDANLVVVEETASATGILVHEMLKHIGSSFIDSTVATALMTALIGDTGFFRYSNTTAITHYVAGELYEYGASAVEIRRYIEAGYQYERQKLLGVALAHMERVLDDNFVYTAITSKMFQETGTLREQTEGIIDQIRLVRGIKAAALIIQEGDKKYKASLRSADGISAGDIAALLGGGGHPKAAGASITGSLDEVTKKVIDAVETILKQESV